MKLGPYDLKAIYTGDARELAKGIPDGSVDLIFTDPPYLKEFLPLYDWLAAEAVRILKPDGFLLAYAGAYWKTEVIKKFEQELDYFFDFILVNGSGTSPIIWNKKVISRHKSILAYRKRGSGALPRTNVISFWVGSGEDKRYHVWGQDESSARYYIDCFSKPGDVILDPFAGGGTTPYVCRVLDRRYLAFELDSQMADVARARVKNVQPVLFDIHEQPLLFSQQKEPQP